MTYPYHFDDLIYDIETKPDVFTDAQYFPAQNKLIISVLQSAPLLTETSAHTFDEADQAVIRQRIRDVNPVFNDTDIVIENLTRIPSVDAWQQHLKQNPHNYSHTDAEYSLIGWLHRLGVANRDAQGQPRFNANINNFVDSQNRYYNSHTNQFYRDLSTYNQTLLTNPQVSTQPFGQYYPIKTTDPNYQPDNIYQHSGLRLGYNSTNYDLTMLSMIIAELDPNILNQVYCHTLDVSEDYTGGLPTAQQIRSFNDDLFANHINHMYEVANHYQQPTRWTLRTGWLSTNRYLDVARFNEKQRKVSLKRISGMLGLQIKESSRLGDDHDCVGDLDHLADLIAYNVSDVYNTKLLFEHPVYQDGFQLKSSLLSTYPETVYQKQPHTERDADIDPLKIRSDRLKADASSAQFIAHVIAPYQKLIDIPAIDLDYPAPDVLAHMHELQAQGKAYQNITLPDQPFDVLEDTKAWVYGTGRYASAGAHLKPHAQAEFEKIYQFYATFRGRNTNQMLSNRIDINPRGADGVYQAEQYLKAWNQDPTRLSKYDHLPDDININQVMATHDTNIFYYDQFDQPTASIVNISIGGIHGAEIKLALYRQRLADQRVLQANLAFLAEQYPDLTVAYRENPELLFPDGQRHHPRDFMLSKSTGKHAYLKKLKPVELFHRDPKTHVQKLRDEYKYVSVDKASHEDFSSYYPTLLTQLAVFKDHQTGADPYADLYHQRLALKQQLKSLTPHTPEYDQINLQQNLRKLLLNSASGAADATFESNIKMNNATISMRIIGQLFAWRIGQAEASHGARVPSTNTDGLYVMGLDAETNDRVLAQTVAPMLINIDPEIIDRFVSKDSNNRVEVDDGNINEAKGGTLTSWQGPDPQKNLSHPAICDRVLAQYLAYHPGNANPMSPADQPFDRAYAAKLFDQILHQDNLTAHRQSKLQLLQWILASGLSKHRYNFIQPYRGNQALTPQKLPRTNRVYLVKQPGDNSVYQTISLVTKRAVPKATRDRRYKNHQPIIQESPDAVNIMAQYVDADTIDDFHLDHQAIGIQKVTDMPERQAVVIDNRAVSHLTETQYCDLIKQIDVDAYLDIIESKFNHSWKN